MNDKRTIPTGEDPVCGMRVDVAKARTASLVLTYGTVDYAFCSDGCLIEFRDDPAWFLDEAYTPAPM